MKKAPEPTIKQAKAIQKIAKKLGAPFTEEPTKGDRKKAEARAEDSEWFQEQDDEKQPGILTAWVGQETVLRLIIKKGVTKKSAGEAITYGNGLFEHYDLKSLKKEEKAALADDFLAHLYGENSSLQISETDDPSEETGEE